MPRLSSRRTAPTEAQPALDAMGLDLPSALRNVTVNGMRTCVRFRESEWDGLVDIAVREGRTVSEVVAEVDRRRGDAALAAALRVFCIAYYRALAQEMSAATPPPGAVLEQTAAAVQVKRSSGW